MSLLQVSCTCILQEVVEQYQRQGIFLYFQPQYLFVGNFLVGSIGTEEVVENLLQDFYLHTTVLSTSRFTTVLHFVRKCSVSRVVRMLCTGLNYSDHGNFTMWYSIYTQVVRTYGHFFPTYVVCASLHHLRTRYNMTL